jgi:4-hydroxybenzoate polyprenyltransferase
VAPEQALPSSQRGLGGIGPSYLDYLRLLRPQQWTKNGFCLAGVLFGPGRMGDAGAWRQAILTMVVFCAVSSAVYVINDIRDRERDRLHPRKRMRPLARGTVGLPTALGSALLLASLALSGGHLLGAGVLACVVVYLVNNLLYCFWLKHKAIFDALSIALGFCLRVCAGVYAVGDLPTTWITLCTFFLAVFLGFSKRRVELAGLLGNSKLDEDHHVPDQRPVLSKYSVPFLDHLVNSSAIMAVMCYALFTTSSGKNPSLVITVPIVFYAVTHYKRLVMLLDAGEEPDRVLLKDQGIQASLALWLIAYFGLTYGNLRWFH